MKKEINQPVHAWLILCCLLFVNQNADAQANRLIDQAEAVNLAERFVARHGYDKKLGANESSIYWVSEGSKDSAKLKRSESIQSRAVIALIKDEDGRQFWSVKFLFRQQQAEREYDFGREVRVSPDGRKISLAKEVIAV